MSGFDFSGVAVGVLALQGGVAEHARMVERLGASVSLVRRERDLVGADGARIDALVLPGGESSTLDRLLRRFGIAEPLRELIAAGTPTLGTCAGLILLAREIRDPAPGQRSLGLLDVAVDRNAFGAQLVSTEAEFAVDAALPGGEPSVRGALIRAPEIVSLGPGARAIVRHDGRLLGATSVAAPVPVAAAADPEAAPGADPGAPPSAADPLSGADRAGPAEPADPAANSSPRPALGTVTGISFHPELSGDPALHRALLVQAATRS